MIEANGKNVSGERRRKKKDPQTIRNRRIPHRAQH